MWAAAGVHQFSISNADLLLSELTAMVPKKNAFGAGSPNCDVAFPAGNLTAAEILAYLPHWLKSIDVIDRLVSNDAKTVVIAAIVDEVRNPPTDGGFRRNTVQIMMSQAMRHAGYEKWTLGTHTSWFREKEHDNSSLSVAGFRTPGQTHLNTQNMRVNGTVSVNFRDLAIHVKKHPTGADSLDLTRCVRYALDHAKEEWLFPDDYERLVTHLGGSARITLSHYDRQVFARREKHYFSSSLPTAATSTVNATLLTNDMDRTRIGNALSSAVARSRSSTPRVDKRKRLDHFPGQGTVASMKRRSNRLVGKAINFREESEAEATVCHHDRIDLRRKHQTHPRFCRIKKASILHITPALRPVRHAN